MTGRAQSAVLSATGTVLVFEAPPLPPSKIAAMTEKERRPTASRLSQRQSQRAGTRAAAQIVLQALSGRGGSDICIVANRRAQPRVVVQTDGAVDELSEELGISFSYADDRAFVAIGIGCRVGIDIESLPADSVGRARRYGVILGAYFEQPEQKCFSGNSAADDPAAFLTLWTRHEAAHKAAGLGLTFPASNADLAGLSIKVIELDVGPGHVASVAADAAEVDVHMLDVDRILDWLKGQ
jgi:phosphopantetheinyl transferase